MFSQLTNEAVDALGKLLGSELGELQCEIWREMCKITSISGLFRKLLAESLGCMEWT